MPFWLAGIVAGLIAGVIMAAIAMMAMMMMNKPMLLPVKLMAGTFQGEAAMQGGGGTIMVGMLLHMMMSAIFGLIFALIVYAIGWTAVIALIIAGIVYALIVWAINQFGTLPIVDKVMAANMAPMVFAMTHIFYGGVLGWLYWAFKS